MKIGIIGAGIGGLTAAVLLKEQGHDVHLFEKEDALREIGAGIGIGDNVLVKLGHHDLAKGLKNAGQVLQQMRVLDTKGTVLSQVTLSQQSTNITLLRQDLIDLIASYVDKKILHLNHYVTTVERVAEGVRIQFENHEAVTVDLCIGADGIHSKVRDAVQPNVKINYQGYTCFRGVVEDMSQFNHIAEEYWDKKGRFGIVPLLNGRAYWFATINAKENDVAYKHFNKPYLQAYFNHFPNAVRQVLDHQPETEILHHDIYDLKPLSTFVYQERVVLLGDAAHATTPNMGQGAGQAMEDAIVLTNVLKRFSTLSEALKRYDRLRVKHTKKVIKRSRRIGRIAQYQNSGLIALRNRCMKMTPDRFVTAQTRFLYKAKSE